MTNTTSVLPPLTTPDLIDDLTPHLLDHYQWSSDELQSYLDEQQLHLYTCPQLALMSYLNLADHPVEAAQDAYQRITALPLESISMVGGFDTWMNQVFEQITSDFGDILTIDGKSYYVIFKDSSVI